MDGQGEVKVFVAPEEKEEYFSAFGEDSAGLQEEPTASMSCSMCG